HLHRAAELETQSENAAGKNFSEPGGAGDFAQRRPRPRRRPPTVAQAFQPAGSRDFPVPFWIGTGDWKVARTRRLESLRYMLIPRAAAKAFLFTLTRFVGEHALFGAGGTLPFLATDFFELSSLGIRAALLLLFNLVEQQVPRQKPVHG